MRTLVRKLSYVLLGAGISISTAGYSAPGTLADKPLWMGSSVKSNVILSLDDSGSMQWEMMFPSEQGRLRLKKATGSFVHANGSSFDYNSAGLSFNYISPWAGGYEVPPVSAYGFVRSPDYNGMYYNPAEDYSPWPGYGDYKGDASDVDGDGNFTNFPNAATPLGVTGYVGTKRNPLLGNNSRKNIFANTNHSSFRIAGNGYNRLVCDEQGNTHGSNPIACPAQKDYTFRYAQYYLKRTTGSYTYTAKGATTADSVVIEAEDGDITTPFDVFNCSSCSGKYVGDDSEGTNFGSSPPALGGVDLFFNSPGTQIEIWLRVKANSGWNDSFWIGLEEDSTGVGIDKNDFVPSPGDDESWSNGFEKFWQGLTGGGNHWVWRKWGTVSNLNDGDGYKLRIKLREDGTFVDQVFITTTSHIPFGAMTLADPNTPGVPVSRSCDPAEIAAAGNSGHSFYEDFRQKIGTFVWNDASGSATTDGLYDGANIEGAIAPDGACLVKYEIPESGTTFDNGTTKTRTLAEEQQNFANWFAYYRRRHYAMRGGVGGAFQGLGNMRVGLFTINDRSSVTMWDLDSDADKDAFLTKHYNGYNASGNTPLRLALDYAGQEFQRTDSDAPIISECQKNFALLFSDGFRNGATPSGLGNEDDGTGAPFEDGYSKTLADVAYKYYHTILRTGPAFPAGQVRVDDSCDGAPGPYLDCNKNLHMNTYTVGFGLQGTVFMQPVDPSVPAVRFETRQDAHTYKDKLVWPAQNYQDKRRVDDMYHAAVNGFGNMYSANSPVELQAQLKNVLKDIMEQSGSGSGVAFNNASLTETVGTGIYATRFVPSDWSGDLLANRLAKSGGETFNSVVYKSGQVIPRSGWGLGTTEETDVGAAPILDARNLVSSPRNIVTFDGTDGIPFEWASLTANQRIDFLDGGSADVAKGKALLAYIRGDRSNESSGYGFRARGSRLGDLVNSSPLHVSTANSNWPNNAPFGDAGNRYDAWALTVKDRTPLVWVGANDGMLHAFNASLDLATDGGKEVFAYVPAGVYDSNPNAGLSYLAKPNYVHRYYVDLTPVAQDVFISSTAGSTETGWRTMLVGGYRAGARGIFALDVTDPALLTQSVDNAKKVILWEFDDSDDVDMGYLVSSPKIAMMNNHKWAVIFGNGYNSASGKTALMILYVEEGLDGTWSTADYKKIVLDTSESVDGLSGVTLADLNDDDIVDRIYAGDLQGNMWVFDVSDSDSNNWDVAYKDGNDNVPLFKAINSDGIAQPITAAPNLAFNTEAQKVGNEPNVFVGFGTGQYLTLSDNTSDDVQSFYIVWDRGYAGATGLNRSNLKPRELEQDDATGVLNVVSTTQDAIDWTMGGPEADKDYGWYMDLIVSGVKDGERVVHRPLFRNSKKDGVVAVFASRIPNIESACSGSGSSKLYVVPILTGLSSSEPIADLDGDGDIDANDAGVGTDKGFLINDPNILSDTIYAARGDGEGVDTMLITPADPSDRSGRLGWHELIDE